MIFIPLGYMETDPQRALARIESFKAPYVLCQDGLPADEILPAFNRCNDAVRQALDDGQLPYVKEKQFPLANGVSVVLYRRHELERLTPPADLSSQP